jgi:hypothetical protein
MEKGAWEISAHPRCAIEERFLPLLKLNVIHISIHYTDTRTDLHHGHEILKLCDRFAKSGTHCMSTAPQDNAQVFELSTYHHTHCQSTRYEHCVSLFSLLLCLTYSILLFTNLCLTSVEECALTGYEPCIAQLHSHHSSPQTRRWPPSLLALHAPFSPGWKSSPSGSSTSQEN